MDLSVAIDQGWTVVPLLLQRAPKAQGSLQDDVAIDHVDVVEEATVGGTKLVN
jgi:hypothetical protein